MSSISLLVMFIFFFYALEHRSIFIMAIVSFSLSAYSVICVLSDSVSLTFPFICISHFLQAR